MAFSSLMTGTPKTVDFSKLWQKTRKNPREFAVHRGQISRFPGPPPGKSQKWRFFIIFNDFSLILDPPIDPPIFQGIAVHFASHCTQKTSCFGWKIMIFKQKCLEIEPKWPPKNLCGGWFTRGVHSFFDPVSLVYKESMIGFPFLDSPTPQKVANLTSFWSP